MKYAELRSSHHSFKYSSSESEVLNRGDSKHVNRQGRIDNHHPVLIPYGRQWIDEEDIQAVVEVLRSDWLTQGPKIREFEEKFADYVNARYAVAVSNGTAALHCAYLAAGLGPGDQVITTPITFAATSNAAFYCGARPAFVDIDPETYNLDPVKLDEYLSRGKGAAAESEAARIQTAESKGRQGWPLAYLPKAVVPVHLSGLPCNMEKIYRTARAHNLYVIEDACHALGARYRSLPKGKDSKTALESGDSWKKVGSCTHSDMSVFSFHPVKHITCGEGGMITTNSKELYGKLLLYRNHGITREFSETRFLEMDSRFYYEMRVLGFNYRMNDLQAALGNSQLKKMDGWLERRRYIANLYFEHFSTLKNVKLPYTNDDLISSFHLFLIQVDQRERWLTELLANGIMGQIHYLPVPLHPYYRGHGYKMEQLPHAASYYKKCLSLPIFPRMTSSEVTRVISAVAKIAELAK